MGAFHKDPNGAKKMLMQWKRTEWEKHLEETGRHTEGGPAGWFCSAVCARLVICRLRNFITISGEFCSVSWLHPLWARQISAIYKNFIIFTKPAIRSTKLSCTWHRPKLRHGMTTFTTFRDGYSLLSLFHLSPLLESSERKVKLHTIWTSLTQNCQ